MLHKPCCLRVDLIPTRYEPLGGGLRGRRTCVCTPRPRNWLLEREALQLDDTPSFTRGYMGEAWLTVSTEDDMSINTKEISAMSYTKNHDNNHDNFRLWNGAHRPTRPSRNINTSESTHTDNNTIQIMILGTMANDIGAIVLRDDIGVKPKT